MTEWKTYRLGDIASFSQGIQVDIDKQLPYKKDGYIRFIRIVDFTKANEPYRYIETPKKQYLTNSGDIVMIRYGSQTAGLVVKSFEGAIANNMFKITLDEQVVDRDFIYYALSQEDIFSSLRNAQSSSTMPAITFEIASRIQLKIPSLEEQRRIAGILGAIDDKIENNRRINTNLELQAQALYKQWFVDSSTVKLGDVVKTTSGGTPSRSHMEFYVGKYGWVKSKELNSSFITKTEETITDDAIAKSAAKLLPAKSILIAMYGATVGQYAILSQPMTCNQAVCALLPNENYPYTYLFMEAKNIKEELANKAIGSAQQNISQVIIKNIDISSDIEKIKQFHKIVCPHFEVMEKNQKENETLATLRDTLLPKLMNEEIKL